MVLLQARDESARTVSRAGFLATPARLRTFAIGMGFVTTLLAAIGSWIPSLWGDEAASVMSAERSLPSLFRMLGHVDAVHGTYYLFLHFWIGAFGASPFSVRFPSAIGAGLAVAGVIVLANRLAGPRVAIFSGIAGAILPRIMYAGSEARGYAFSAAAVVWLTYLLVRLVQSRTPGKWLWVLYAGGVALSGYIFLFDLLILIPHAIYFFMASRSNIRRWALATGAGLLLALPVIAYGIGERAQVAFLTRRTAATFISSTVTPWFGNSDFAMLGWAFVLVAAGVSIRAWLRTRRTRPHGPDRTLRAPGLVPLALMWLLVPGGILLTINIFHAIYSSRYLTFTAPAAALLIGWLLGQITRKWVIAVLIAALVTLSWTSYQAQRTPYAQNGSDWAAIGAVIHAHAEPGDAVLFDEGTKPSKLPRLAERIYPQDFAGLQDVGLKTPWYRTNNWRDTSYPLDDVTSRLAGVHTVWMVEYRTPHGTADTYDIATLHALGFTQVGEYAEHSSVVMKFLSS
jgi:mannosyltransferase